MSGQWTALVALAATLLVLLWAKRWITRHLQILGLRWLHDSNVVLLLYYVVVLPGVVVHELSHLLAAMALGVKVGRLQLMPERINSRKSKVTLGSVRVARTDPVRGMLIGLAPLIGGTAVILLIGNSVLGVDELMARLAGPGSAGLWAGLRALLGVRDFWLWLYLIFAVSNAMLPSESDMAAVRPVLVFLGLAAGVVLVAGGVPSLSPDVAGGIAAGAGYLAAAFGLALAVDAFFMLIIAILDGITVWIKRRRGEYSRFA